MQSSCSNAKIRLTGLESNLSVCYFSWRVTISTSHTLVVILDKPKTFIKPTCLSWTKWYDYDKKLSAYHKFISFHDLKLSSIIQVHNQECMDRQVNEARGPRRSVIKNCWSASSPLVLNFPWAGYGPRVLKFSWSASRSTFRSVGPCSLPCKMYQ